MKAVQDNVIKKALSWEDKVNLCNAWKKTGMSKSEFARRNRLSIRGSAPITLKKG